MNESMNACIDSWPCFLGALASTVIFMLVLLVLLVALMEWKHWDD